MSNSKKILLQVTGSIAAFKAVALCSKLVQANFEVEVVLSEGAEKFVGAASFEGMTRKPVHRGLYDQGQMMAHIDLERWADLLVVYPASANTISSLATGRSDSLIGSVFLAHEFKKPYWVVPAMNQAMIAHPAIQAHLQTLKKWGVDVFNSDEGSLACGEIGHGRLIEPEVMLEKISTYRDAKTPPVTNRENGPRVLITSGGTTEPIDDVRSITNFSTGETGYTLAKSLASEGCQVTLVQSRASHFQLDHITNARSREYTNTDEFVDVVKDELKNRGYDVMIHAAAVADYRVEKTKGKIQSDQPFDLKLIPNEKVLKSVRSWSKNPALKVVSFKLTSGEGDHASVMKLDSYDSEFVIHNEKKNVNGKNHAGTVFEKNSKPGSAQDRYQAGSPFTNKTELSALVSTIVSNLTSQSVKKEIL
jgi:phosphopantothenoylcysteine decarboxylase/phosphopantothenate--cysteine ligase